MYLPHDPHGTRLSAWYVQIRHFAIHKLASLRRILIIITAIITISIYTTYLSHDSFHDYNYS